MAINNLLLNTLKRMDYPHHYPTSDNLIEELGGLLLNVTRAYHSHNKVNYWYASGYDLENKYVIVRATGSPTHALAILWMRIHKQT